MYTIFWSIMIMSFIGRKADDFFLEEYVPAKMETKIKKSGRKQRLLLMMKPTTGAIFFLSDARIKKEERRKCLF